MQVDLPLNTNRFFDRTSRPAYWLIILTAGQCEILAAWA